jgi:hypothetical protein
VARYTPADGEADSAFAGASIEAVKDQRSAKHGETARGAFLSGLERIAKVSALFFASVYFFGYLVTALRLAEYDVVLPQLVDAQYLAAGLFPALLLWGTIFVIFSAWRYEATWSARWKGDPRAWRQLAAEHWLGSTTLAVIFAWCVLVLVTGASTPVFSDELTTRIAQSDVATISSLIGLAAVTTWGLIWLLVVGARHLFSGGANSLIAAARQKEFARLPDVVLYVVTVALLGFLALPFISTLTAYEVLPQGIGGGRPYYAEFYVDRVSVPRELLAEPDGSPGDEDAELARTAPVAVLLESNERFVVATGTTGAVRVWKIDADSVRAQRTLQLATMLADVESRLESLGRRVQAFEQVVDESDLPDRFDAERALQAVAEGRADIRSALASMSEEELAAGSLGDFLRLAEVERSLEETERLFAAAEDLVAGLAED